MRRMYSENQLLKAIEKESQENGIKVFENIVDKNGNARFIEGNITIEEITGVTKTYGKWSLSGSHLLVVLALDIDNTSELPAGKVASLNNLPEWVYDKIAILFSTSIVDVKDFIAYGSDFTTQTQRTYIVKVESGIELHTSALTYNKARKVRFSFDLLIDNE